LKTESNKTNREMAFRGLPCCSPSLPWVVPWNAQVGRVGYRKVVFSENQCFWTSRF
jgi:hypothetical protein